MNLYETLRQQMAGLQRLARWQRGARLGLRAIWLGLGGFLVGWSLQQVTGKLASPWMWAGLGLSLAIWPVLAFLLTLKRPTQWVWHLDRRLGFQEQVSTAWDVVQRGEKGQVPAALVEDVANVLPVVRNRMLRNGWFIERDLVSSLVVAMLCALVFLPALIRPYAGVARNPTIPMPGMEPDPKAADVFPKGPLGLSQPGAGQTPGQGPGQGQGQQNQPNDQQNGSGDQAGQQSGGQPNAGAAAEALKQLGEALSQQAPTYDAGQALKNSDLNGAAQALDKLSDQMQDLSQKTKEQMGQAMQQAGQALQQNGDSSRLGQDLNDAAQAMQGQGAQEQSHAMDQVAGDLRQMAQAQQDPQQGGPAAGAGGSSSSGQTGNAEPAQRLAGEGGEMDLPVEDASQSGLLTAGDPNAEANGTASGSGSGSGGGNNTIPGSLVPNTFWWMWRNVVSSYFQH